MLDSKSSTLTTPFEDQLVDLMVSSDAKDDLKTYASKLPSIQIYPQSLCDLVLLASGALSPLDRFMGSGDCESVLDGMHLLGGQFFPMPITLAVSSGDDLHLDRDIAIRNSEFELLAVMTVEEIYSWDRDRLVDSIPGPQENPQSCLSVVQQPGLLNISGKIQVLQLPYHHDFQKLWLSPSQTRAIISQISNLEIIALHPGSPMLPSLEQVFLPNDEGAHEFYLLQLAVGIPKPGDYDYHTMVSTYRDLAEDYLDPERYLLSLLPLSLRNAGFRETLLQALIQRNFGASYSYVGRNHQLSNDPGMNSQPDKIYDFLLDYQDELDIKFLSNEFNSGQRAPSRSNSKVNFPSDFTPGGFNPSAHPSEINSNTWQQFQQAVTNKLLESQPQKHEKGVCIWFTGFSGSGKSTTAEILSWSLLEHGRRVTVLDGDVVRTHLSNGLGFSKADRDTNVRRIGFVASELVRLGGVVICSVVSPYRAARDEVRNMVGADQFIEVYVNTPINICEQRDAKGFYAKARRMEIKGFTGIDDPYEPPENPEITLETIDNSPEDNAKFIIDRLTFLGFIKDLRKQELG